MAVSFLPEDQTVEIIAHLENVIHYDTHQIVTHIKATYDVELTFSGINKWLHYAGFSYKKI